MTRQRASAAVMLLTVTALVIGLVASPAFAHGQEFDVVVEAVGPEAGQPAQIALGVVLSFVDGDPYTGASVTITAVGGSKDTTEIATETVAGVYTAILDLDRGSWEVTIDIEGESDGQVTFMELVGDTFIAEPVVRVDTAHPERQGLTVRDDSAISGAATESETQTLVGDLRVEALVRDAIAPLRVDYGVLAPTAATAAVTGRKDDGSIMGPVFLTTSGSGSFRGQVEFPASGQWLVEVALDGSLAATFNENLPWPHYSTEAGFPKIKVASTDISLEGTLITVAESPVFGLPAPSAAAASSTTTSLASTGAEELPPAPFDVTVNLPDTASELRRQVVLRWLHLGSLGAWILALFALFRRWPKRTWRQLAVASSVATIATGFGLVLWGAPTAFPGIFRWSDLGDRLYGSAYEAAFVVKMLFVATALGATTLLAAQSTRGRFLVALGSIGGAVAALVAMSQFHLWAHL